MYTLFIGQSSQQITWDRDFGEAVHGAMIV